MSEKYNEPPFRRNQGVGDQQIPLVELIPDHILRRWQSLLDTMTEILGAPVGRLMRVLERDIEVAVAGGTTQNPYRPGGREPLIGSGLYCETVARDRTVLSIPDASVDPYWRDSPDAARGMLSYLGFPILWPDGSLFGTIDVLDLRPNTYSAPQRRLIEQFRSVIEDHLALIAADRLGPMAVADMHQREIRLNEERYRLLVDNSADDFVLHDEKGQILDVNQQACRDLGYSRNELLRLRIADFSITYSPDQLENIWTGMQPGTGSVFHTTHRQRDGSVFPVEVHISCLSIDGRKLFFSMARDISERVEAERAIQMLNAELEQRVADRTLQWRKSVDLLQAVMDGATDAIFVKDVEGRFLLFNRAAASFADRAVEDVLGRTIVELSGRTVGEAIRKHELEVLRSGKASTVEETMVTNGVTRLFLATRSPYRDEYGKVIGLIGISRDITEKRRSEEALRDSEARWHFAVEGTGDGIWDWNLESGRVFYSQHWKAMLGYGEDEVGDTLNEWSDRVHPDDISYCWQIIDAHFKSDTTDFSLTHRMRAKDGSWRWIQDRGKVVKRAPDGRPLRVIGTHTDITARKIEEDELRVQRERLVLATEASHLGVWDYNLDSNTILCDKRWYDIFGIDPRSSVDTIETFNACLHPDDVDRVTRERLSALAARKTLQRIDYRIITPTGEMRWIFSSACWIERTDLTPNRLVGIVMDITESRLAEERLQRSYESLRQAERLSRIGSWTLDLASGQFSCSDMLYEINGADPAGPPLTVADLPRLLAPESYRRMSIAVAKCAETGEPYGMEVEHLRPAGPSFPAYIRGQAYRDASGKITSLSGVMQDITEREEARARLAVLADNLPSGAIYRLEHDAHGRYGLTYFSAGIQRLIGVPAAEIIADRQVFLQSIHDEDRAPYQAAIERSLSTREVFDYQFRASTRDGRLIWMHCRSAPRLQSDGTTVWDGIIRDITREQKVAEALEQAKETAEAAERAKRDFLATMSHEIRTPMNTVIGMTRLTLQTDLAPKQRNYLEKIDASARSLLSIIDDVLDFSKIEAGKLELEDTHFTLESLLESVSAVTSMRAEEKGLEIAYAIASEVPRQLRGDSLRLGQVLTNLVSNAVKFTHQGEVVVAVSLLAEGAVPMLQFAVRDTGIGLDAHQISGLFQPFSQADSRTSRRYGGTGLGLAICKQLIERMGGKIWVESEPGRGSTFFFTIGASDLSQTVPTDASLRPPLLQGRRILIVDDNASARAILLDMVRGFGVEAEGVDSGAKALATLRSSSLNNEPFDLVLMDWRMPAMDGLETARRIRTEESLRRMPAVLMVTAYGRQDVLQRVQRLGLQGLLIKPVTESVMFNTILDILAIPGPRRSAGATEWNRARPRGALPTGILSLLAGRRALVVDDNALNREVACDFLLAAGMDVDTAVNGIEALQQLDHRLYDVVLMDMHMPEMDGLAATQEIRRHARWSALPIIALTAQARVEDRNASLDAGMTAYLTKPIDEATLYRTLIAVLAASPAPNARAGHKPEIEPSPGAQGIAITREPGLDLSPALKRLGDNPDRLERLLRGFLRDFADAPTRLDEHLRKVDIAQIASLAHTVKGAVGYFDASGLCESAEQVEEAARRGDGEAVRICAPAFRSRLQRLLTQIDQSLAGSGAPPMPADEVDVDALLRLIQQIDPLIPHGDYAAFALLERLSAALAGHREVALADEVLAHFDELELAATSAALLRLKANLQARNGGLPP